MDEHDLTKSRWLKQAEADLRGRDPVDALNDAEALVRFARRRLKDAVLFARRPLQ